MRNAKRIGKGVWGSEIPRAKRQRCKKERRERGYGRVAARGAK